MKRPICVLLLMIFVCMSAYADGSLSVHSSNGFDVWAVGTDGNVFHSVDGGTTWSSLTQGTTMLRSVFTLGNSVFIVGESGKCFHSSDNGNTWAEQTLSSGINFNAVLLTDNQTGFAIGSNGAIFKTVNGGTSWESKSSSTTQKLNAVAFASAQIGYAVGAAGVMLKTTNGGENWLSVGGLGWTKDLTSISVNGSTIYVTGIDAFCAKSANGGSTWMLLNFDTDSRSDVNGVFVKNANEAVFVGGGGYVRVTNNGGSTFTWGRHSLHGTMNSVFFYDNNKGWACSEKSNVVLRTTDGGSNWALPAGTTVNMNWVQKLSVSATVRGNAFSINAYNQNIIYCGLGESVYASYNRGETWVLVANLPSGTKTNSFYVSPKDTNLWVAAYGSPDRIIRSTDHGVTWTATLTKDFSEYGMPLEMDGSHPDTLLFCPEDGHLWRSTDFGATWTDYSAPGFRSPCDIVIARDNPEVIWVGDGVTGSGNGIMHRSRDGGRTFQIIYTTTGSEIPTTVGSSLDNNVGYATAWGSGGVMKTSDMAQTWTSVATTSSTWGIDIAKDDPNVIIYGVYGGATSYLSSNAALSFATSSLSGSNYALYAYDRGTFFAQQSGGIFKYNFTYTVPSGNLQVLTVTSPVGGEIWPYSTTRNITWAASNIANVKIEYKTSPSAAWQTVITSTPGGTGTYAWTIPNAPTIQARVRISDVMDSNPIDSTHGVFSITAAAIAAQPASLGFGNVMVGSSQTQVVTLNNSGTAVLVVTSVVASDPNFVPGRTSFTIAAGQSDTLSVRFSPSGIRTFNEQLSIGCNAPGSPFGIPLSGNSVSAATLAVLTPNGGEVWQANTTHAITWSATGLTNVELSYNTSPSGSWQRIIQSVPASQGSFMWTVPNTPSVQARVRIVDRTSGAVVDSSDAVFAITGPTGIADVGGIPTKYELHQNFPNPFNPSTVIVYGVPKDGFVSLKVFNLIGQEIATLVSERRAAGRYSVMFDTQKLAGSASGLYFYRLSAGHFVELKKMIVLK